MTVPILTGVQLGGDPASPLLVLGPSLGVAVHPLWDEAARTLSNHFHVVAWDLPGHGRTAPAAEAFTMAELAEGVLTLVDEVLAERGEPGGSFAYAGVSAGGAVGLQLLVDHPGRIGSATLLCTGARSGTPESWAERSALVRAGGTSAVVEASAQRWFAPGFVERRPAVASGLLTSLQDADGPSYAWVCQALAGFDLRDRLGEIGTPVLAVAGAVDVPTPVESLRAVATGVRRGRLVVLDDVAHLAPAEAPAEVARLVTAHDASSRTAGEIREAGSPPSWTPVMVGTVMGQCPG